jgi:arylsulfatase A-like enzyme
MNIYHIVAMALLASISVLASSGPNVVFILADDLGITDIAAYASHFTGKETSELYYETPNMDRLVNKGIAFSQAYANQLCSPTRAAIMTGQYAARHGFTTATPLTKTYYNQGMVPPDGFDPNDVLEHKDNIKEPQAWINGRSNTALDPKLPTLPKVLKTHRSVFIGKWHLGGHGAKGFQPLDQGFDEAPAWFDAGASFYFETGSTDHYSWKHGWNNKINPFPNMPQDEYTVGDAGPDPHADYLTDDLTDRTVNFIERYAIEKKSGKEPRPFFLYFCHFAVHTPLQAPAETVAYFERKPQRGTLGQSNAVYAAMVKKLDDSVGRVLQILQKTGLDKNTLVVLTSDNGGVEYTDPPATDNAPFKGGKACLTEGGVRVPLVYWQSSRFEGGAWCDVPVNCIDFLPTLAELTSNRAPDNLDGISMVPLLNNPSAKGPSRTFIWHYPFNVIVKDPDNGLPLTPHSAIRVGDYKLIWDWHGKLELFDIPADPYETNDLSAQMPEKRDELMEELQGWLKDHVAPRYMPIRNPDYNAAEDKRPYPFMDLSGDLTH